MFYESDRIVRKQKRYEKTRAYVIISNLKQKGLSVNESIEAIDILLDDDNTEFQVDVLSRAKATLKAQREVENGIEEENITNNKNSGNNDTSECPVINYYKQYK